MCRFAHTLEKIVCRNLLVMCKRSWPHCQNHTLGERPLSSDKIGKNIKTLKGKLRKNTSQLYHHLFLGVNEVSVSELTWKDLLANQVISDDSDLVEKLPEQLKESFMVNSSFFIIQSYAKRLVRRTPLANSWYFSISISFNLCYH